jgi:glycosyltransferase involved in cell wall biosynthesis
VPKGGAIVVAHSYYNVRGGEDSVFESEIALLESNGHRVVPFVIRNDQYLSRSPLRQAQAAFWNFGAADALKRIIRASGARVVHFHNTFPFMSPSVIHAAKSEGAAVVMTLHNFRLLCVQGVFSRDGKICRDCVGLSFPHPAIRHGCYRSNRLASATVTTALTAHRVAGTWTSLPDAYIALTEFSKSVLQQATFLPDRIFVKPNFVGPDVQWGTARGGYAVYAGRLSPEKGIETLLAAWMKVGVKLPLYIVGDGPQAELVAAAAKRNPMIRPLGFKSRLETLRIVGDASVVLVPSTGLEGCPLLVLEALASGIPIVASRLGALIDMVPDGVVGRVFTPGDAEALAFAVEHVCRASSADYAKLRQNARALFESRFSSAANYRSLLSIYEFARARSRSALSRRTDQRESV